MTDIISKQKNEQSRITELLRDIAHKKASALRWNTYSIVMFYCLLFVVILLQLIGSNIFLVTGITSLGLLILLVISRLRFKKLEEQLYIEEMDNYQKIMYLEKQDITEIEGVSTNLPLSRREIEVLARIAEGLMNKQIAIALGISSQTVKNHISNILYKLDVHDRTSAVLIGVSRGWISLPSSQVSVADKQED